MRPILLDVFCGAGGCTKGYQQAGFYVVGVDVKHQPRYCGDEFIQADALEYLATADLSRFAAIHASPPCQGYSVTANMPWVGEYPKLIEPVRELLIASGKPYVIENVIGAPLLNPVMLCGTQFGLKVFRHRLFETSWFCLGIPHVPHRERIGVNGYVCVAGHGDAGRGRIPADHRSAASWQRGMGVDWMTMAEMAQAIPPAYCKWIGERLMQTIEETA